MNFNVPVIYEDEYIVVFDKPSGLIVNISNTSGPETLQSLLVKKYNLPFEPLDKSFTRAKDPEDSEEFDEFKQRSGLVHRIDKQTSGLIVVAKSDSVFKSLQSQFKNREVKKEYIALVLGHVDFEGLTIDAGIKRNPNYRLKMIMSKDGKPAVTDVKLLRNITQNEDNFSLVKVFPKTGRTHQIRVHMAGINHPIISDDIYMTKKNYDKYIEKYPRLMLHASGITFTHPIKNTGMTLSAPLPDIFPQE